ncbi:MAG: hypothetical protein WCK20_07715 [Thermoleophilia bacterium]
MNPRIPILLLVLVFGLTACGPEQSSNKERFDKMFQMPLPQGALGLVNEENRPFFRAKWMYSSFWLPPKEMENFISKPPEGFGPWEKDFDLGFADRYFISDQWPQNARCSMKNTAHEVVFFVADPDRGLVHAVAWIH